MSNPPINKRATPRQATSAVAYEHERPAPNDPLLAFPPYLHKAPRRNSITPDLQREFIAHLAATGIVNSAARHIGRSMEALYKLRQREGAEGFARAWDKAVDYGITRLEDSALARAIQGEERAIVSSGKIIGYERRHNEGLVMFFLRNRMAERYGPEREKPTDKIYAELEEQAMEAAREYMRERTRHNLTSLTAVLDHMVENRLAGRAYAHGIDPSRTLIENAEMLAGREG
ncbi:hypothetical protein ACRAQ6_09740 [Erythrobacter sp. HA6-11]